MCYALESMYSAFELHYCTVRDVRKYLIKTFCSASMPQTPTVIIFFFSLSLCLCFSFSLYLCLSLSLTLTLSRSRSLSLSLSHTPSHSHSLLLIYIYTHTHTHTHTQSIHSMRRGCTSQPLETITQLLCISEYWKAWSLDSLPECTRYAPPFLSIPPSSSLHLNPSLFIHLFLSGAFFSLHVSYTFSV